MNATTGNDLPAQVRASDSDRDAVVSDLSMHFQAGRLTAGEFDERMGRALAARTWGELRELLADLPAAQPGPRAPATSSLNARPRPSSGRPAPPVAALAGLAMAVAVLVMVANVGWGLAWLLIPGLLIARRLVCSAGAPRRSGPE
jgi:ferric-dicitrate binding protein FerR (iron transport regulator)